MAGDEMPLPQMTQIEEHLNSKFEETLKEIRVNRSSYTISDEDDAENNRPGPSNSENRILRKKHASKTPIDKDKNQDDCFQLSEISELRQPYALVGVVNETLDETFSNKQKQTRNTFKSLIQFW